MQGVIYIIATPIGNLEDITLRAIKILKSVDLILAEDTRVAKKLLNHYDIKTNVLSYHQHSSEAKKLSILAKLLGGKNIALITDAGTPGLSDPGNELISFFYERNSQYQHAERLAASGVNRKPSKVRGPDIDLFRIIPIPGPSSLTAAISICGFNMSQFTFLGYFPKKKKLKLAKFITESKIPVIYFDSPHRVTKNLKLLLDELGDRELFVARELTKLHEETYRGTISNYLEINKNKLQKGEFVVIVCP